MSSFWKLPFKDKKSQIRQSQSNDKNSCEKIRNGVFRYDFYYICTVFLNLIK